MTGVPCPSCGMTTSFALLLHGDIANSLRANAVGTLLAVFCLVLIPWSLACVVFKRFFLIVSLDRAHDLDCGCFHRPVVDALVRRTRLGVVQRNEAVTHGF